MGRNDILQEPGNAKNIKKLIAQKKFLVPFIGAGFSAPACPTWSAFLDLFFDGIKEEFLHAREIQQYLQLKNSGHEKKFEKMADFLVEKSGRRKFEEEISAHFDKPLPPQMKPKFHLLHRAFPGLKITTNFDCLVENNAPGPDVWVCHGTKAGELERLFTRFEQNSLLKIHGGLRDIHSIVLASSQYAALYGHPTGFDSHAPLPLFLKRVFTNCSLLFIGCSLAHDRTIMIMESLEDMRPHFAIMKQPGKKDERVELNRWLSKLGITSIRIEDFAQIREILQQLVEPAWVDLGPPLIEPGVPFVGRAAELKQIRENLEQAGSSGSVQVVTGRLFSIEGAGGVGKTTLAIEAAKRFKAAFKDGVLNPIRVDEHTPVSFAMHLAAQLKVQVDEPPDPVSARALVTGLLKDRQCLLILDNAVDWNNLQYMLPMRTGSTLLVTTRNRDMYRHLRLKFKEVRVHEIPLEKFTPEEALALFQQMLETEYRDSEKDIYLEIADNLGYLPIALRQAISLMVFTPHYQASVLRDKLAGENRLALLRKGQVAEDSDSRVIETVFDLSSPLLTGELKETLEYLSICSPGPVPLDFLQQLAKNDDAAERLEQLYTFSWCERRESNGQRAYELHQLVRELVRGCFENRFQERFIQLVHDIFTDKSVHFSIKEKFYLQLEEALLAASANRDKRLIDWLYDLYDFCTFRGFADFYIRLTQRVETLFPGDRWALIAAYAHRALIYRRQGKLEEAMKFNKKVEKIEEELGNPIGLAESYGNQALILKAWGKLTEAMALHKKEEKICEELGHRVQLARSYGNQALILSTWGKLTEAMALYKKEEKIHEELGDRDQLARSYGNQALILSTWGKLTEAMALHKKEEKICEELGDRAGLARTWWDQGLIYNKKRNYKKQSQLWQKSIQINKEIGIPTTGDEKELAKLLKEKGIDREAPRE
ncbi:MAG: SIR2 family protein [Candidatus Aminicenantes bacterium]|nr:MAG: SIR2 family protein [Candidatus Aminicenantes bacterium]